MTLKDLRTGMEVTYRTGTISEGKVSWSKWATGILRIRRRTSPLPFYLKEPAIGFAEIGDIVDIFIEKVVIGYTEANYTGKGIFVDREGDKCFEIRNLDNDNKSYRLNDDGSITCLLCGLTSYHIEDVKHLWCNNCKISHGTQVTIKEAMLRQLEAQHERYRESYETSGAV